MGADEEGIQTLGRRSARLIFQASSTPRTLLERLLVGLLIGFLALTPWFYGLVRLRDQLVAECFLFSLFLVFFPLINWRKAFQPATNEADFWVAIAGALSLIYVVISVLPYQSFLAFLKLSSLIALYGLVRGVVTTTRRFQIFLWAILSAGFFYSLYGLAQYFDFLPHSHWTLPYGLASRFVNGSHFAVLLLFPLLIGTSLLTSSSKLFTRLILSIILCVIGWAFLYTRSRAAWVVFVAGLIVFFQQTLRRGTLGSRKVWALVALGAVGLLLLRQTGGFTLLLDRTGDLWRNKFYSLTHRLNLWQGSLLAIQERPWGWGLGTFGWVFPPYKVQSDRFLVDYAHNEFLQTGVDLGIPGLLVLAAFLFFYLRRLFSLAAPHRALEGLHSIPAGFASLFVCLAVASQVDFPLRIYANGVYFFTFLALSAYPPSPPSSTKEALPPRSWMKLLCFLFVSLLIMFTGLQLFAESSFMKAKVLDQNFQWNEALAKYREASRLAPFYGRYHEGLGNLYYRKASLALRRSDKTKFRAQAAQAYQKAVEALPLSAGPHRLLGIILEEKGDFEGAKFHLKEASRLEPQNGFYLAEYGNFALRHSLDKEAFAAFGKLLKLIYWGETPESVCSVLKKCYQLTQNYHKVLAVTPDDEGGHRCLGEVLKEAGQLDLAKMEFEKANEIRNRLLNS